MPKNKPIPASKIAHFLKLKLIGQNILIKKPVPIYELRAKCFSFIKKEAAEESLLKTINKQPQALVICPPNLKNKLKTSFIVSERPYLSFSRALRKFFPRAKPKIVKGKNCQIKPNVILGGEGFSYQQNEKGVPERVAQIGGVKIGDNVEIGASTAIDRGILTDTIIESDVKIDNLVHIGHNCVIGKGSIIVAGVSLGGGVVIGKNCFIGLNACIKQRVKIGDKTIVGMGAVVIDDVPAGMTVVGNPAKPLIKK